MMEAYPRNISKRDAVAELPIVFSYIKDTKCNLHLISARLGNIFFFRPYLFPPFKIMYHMTTMHHVGVRWRLNRKTRFIGGA